MIDPLQPPINSRVAKKPEIWGGGRGRDGGEAESVSDTDTPSVRTSRDLRVNHCPRNYLSLQVGPPLLPRPSSYKPNYIILIIE